MGSPIAKRVKIFGTIIVSAILVVAAIRGAPLHLWLYGRPHGTELELVTGGPVVPLSSRIWIDTDAACGATPNTDPDDCFAVLWLVDNAADIRGISSSFGNASGDVVQHTLAQFDNQLRAHGFPEIPIWHGSSRPNDGTTGTDAAAHNALRAALKEGPLTILALGPLTNIAAALEGHPELRANVTRLVAVMGHRPGQLFHPSEGSRKGLMGHGPIFRDLNFSVDPESVRLVQSMGLPTTLIPYDAAHRVIITREDLDKWSQRGGVYRWLAERARGWLAFWLADVGQPGFYPFDWVAAAYVLRPELFDCAIINARIDREWAFWVYPRTALLVEPVQQEEEGSTTDVLYCPRTNPMLHEYLLSVKSR